MWIGVDGSISSEREGAIRIGEREYLGLRLPVLKRLSDEADDDRDLGDNLVAVGD